MPEPDWIAQVRARSGADPARMLKWYPEDVPRLLACAEALAELVALRDGSLLRNDAPRHEVRREMEAAWERARAALGEGA